MYYDARCDGNEKFDVFEVDIQGSSRMGSDPPISALRVVLIGWLKMALSCYRLPPPLAFKLKLGQLEWGLEKG